MLFVHWVTGNFPTKVAGDKNELMEPQWVWELQTSADLCPAPRCSCCATMKAPGQGQSRWGALQTCATLALSAFKRNGVSVSRGQGTSMTRSGGKMDQGKKCIWEKK